MLDKIYQLKILDPVIEFVTVDMVDLLLRQEFAPKMASHNVAMRQHAFSCGHGNAPIAIPTRASSTGSAIPHRRMSVASIAPVVGRAKALSDAPSYTTFDGAGRLTKLSTIERGSVVVLTIAAFFRLYLAHLVQTIHEAIIIAKNLAGGNT